MPTNLPDSRLVLCPENSNLENWISSSLGGIHILSEEINTKANVCNISKVEMWAERAYIFLSLSYACARICTRVGVCSHLPPCRPQVLHSGLQACGKFLYTLGCLAGHSEQVLPLCCSHLCNGERNTAAKIVMAEVQVVVCGGSSRMVTKINLQVFRECLPRDRLWGNAHCYHCSQQPRGPSLRES